MSTATPPARTGSALLPRAAAGGVINPQAWIEQPFFFSERTRGKALFWPAGSDWFVNDPLPPAPHCHPGASELYVVVQGRLQVTIGRTEFVAEQGDACLIPTGTFHHPQDSLGTDLCLWCVVAPNWRGRRLKLEGFTEEELSPEPVRGTIARPGPLPSDAMLEASVRSLQPGEDERHPQWREGSERLIYMLEGEAQVTVDRLSGVVGPHEFVHVPSGARHAVRPAEDAPVTFISVYTLDPPGLGLLDPIQP